MFVPVCGLPFHFVNTIFLGEDDLILFMLTNLDLLHFHVYFRIGFNIHNVELAGILLGVTLNLQIKL